MVMAVQFAKKMDGLLDTHSADLAQFVLVQSVVGSQLGV